MASGPGWFWPARTRGDGNRVGKIRVDRADLNHSRSVSPCLIVFTAADRCVSGRPAAASPRRGRSEPRTAPGTAGAGQVEHARGRLPPGRQRAGLVPPHEAGDRRGEAALDRLRREPVHRHRWPTTSVTWRKSSPCWKACGGRWPRSLRRLPEAAWSRTGVHSERGLDHARGDAPGRGRAHPPSPRAHRREAKRSGAPDRSVSADAARSPPAAKLARDRPRTRSSAPARGGRTRS